MTLHVPNLDDYDWTILNNIKTAANRSRKALSAVTATDRWNIPALLQQTKNYDGKVQTTLRKPKVVVDMFVTSKGNLTVRWQPHPDGNDFTYRSWELEEGYFQRPRNEIFFARDFETALYSACEEPSTDPRDRWDQALRQRMAEVTLSLANGIIDELMTHCDVELDTRIEVDRDPETGLITGWRYENLEQIRERERLEREARAEQSRISREAAASEYRAGIQAKVDDAMKFYGIPAERLIGLIDGLMANKLNFSETLTVLRDRFGMVEADTGINHVGATRAIRRAMRELGIEPIAVQFTKEETDEFLGKGTKAAATQKPKELPEHTRRELQERIRRQKAESMTASPPMKPRQLDYSRMRPYVASAEELDAAGIGSVDELVAKINGCIEREGGFRVTQSDYPTNRKKFERLLERWHRMLPPDEAPATPQR